MGASTGGGDTAGVVASGAKTTGSGGAAVTKVAVTRSTCTCI